jgi:hypothetical protein
MATWSVALHGEAADLNALVALLVGVVKEGDGFVFRSPELDALTDPHEVHQLTAEWVEVFNGISRIEEGDSKARMITVGGLVRDDGTRKETFIIPGAGEMRVRGKDLGPRNFPGWVALAARDAAVVRALRFFAGPVTSFSLWNVYEVIREDTGGKAELVRKGLATDDDIDRFRSMHFPSVLGYEARHAVVDPKWKVPDRPMSLDEAQAFVTRLLKRWLDSK